MLPEKLSTDPDLPWLRRRPRVALVVEMTFDKEGAMTGSDVYQALVKNKAKLAYNSVAAWLEGKGPMPAPIGAVAGLDANIRTSSTTWPRNNRGLRHMRGALSLQTIQARPVFDGELLRDLVPDQSNVAKSLIEELMVAANGVTARYLSAKNFPSIRRVVRTPAKWDQIVAFAAGRGGSLPKQPDGVALEQYLLSELKKSPGHFPDLSLFIIKLLGRGEYVVELPGGTVAGHFGLAVADYAHSTSCPTRRFPDLLIQAAWSRPRRLGAAASPTPMTSLPSSPRTARSRRTRPRRWRGR